MQVCRGTYHEGVVLPPTKTLTLVGIGHPVIDATAFDNGVLALASGSVVEGFTIENATGEGILVQGIPGRPITNVTIADNVVTGNDRGNPNGEVVSDSPYPPCNGAPGIPGDCGEGVHLMVADDSSVVGNRINGNSGGVLLTDEFGPTDGNLVADNSVFQNLNDCGITLAGHNPGAFVGGHTAPSAAGVFANRIVSNTVWGNGILGQGGGVLMASPLPGGGVYNNLVQANRIWGNGLAGVTVHSHAPGQDLNGNFVQGNIIGTNNLDGDPDFFPLVDSATTGVIVASVTPLSIGVSDNLISSNTFGIWTTPPATVSGVASNTFTLVTIPFFVA